jgi:hypothetical protein
MERDMQDDRKGTHVLPEVEQYFKTVDAVRSDTAQALESVSDTVKVAALTTFAATSVDAAWLLLGAITDNKVAAWIVAEFSGADEETRDAVEEILQRLPASQAEIEEFAESRSWCESFDEALERAVAAGVFDADAQAWADSPEVAAALEELDEWVRRQVPVTPEALEELHKHVLAVASAARLVGSAPVEESDEDEPEGEEESSGSVLDISSWSEWEALSREAERLMSRAYVETLKEHVTAVAVYASENRTRTHTVEDSGAAVALRNWVTSIGGSSRLGELRQLVTPIVVRAARS